MPVIGSVVGEIAAPVSSGLDSTAGGVVKLYRFDGVSSRAALDTGWRPRAQAFSVEVSFTVEKIDVEQILLDTAGGVRIGITTDNKVFFRVEPNTGASPVTKIGTNVLSVGDSVRYTLQSAWFLAPFTLGTISINGAAGTQDALQFNLVMDVANDAAFTKYLAAPADRSAEPGKEFRGPIRDIFLVDNSPLSGKYINTPTTVNGRGVINTPIPISGDFSIQFQTIREADSSKTLFPLASSANNDNHVKLKGASNSSANDVGLKIGGDSVTWTAALAFIAPGQHYTIRFSRTGTTVSLSIDLVSKGNKTLSTNGVFDTFGSNYANTQVYANGMAAVTITSAFGTASYTLEEPDSGTVIKNTDATSGSTYDGAWFNSADLVWTFIEKNNRSYPANEGAGQYLYDTQDTGTDNKFTIESFNALNWMPIGAVNYYVDPGAAASGSGYASTPFDDFSEINASNSIVAGGTIHIKAGTELRGSLSLSGVAGVNVQKYGTGSDPIINGSAIEAGTWAQDGTNGNAWYLAWTGALGAIWVDNVLLVNKSTTAAMQSDTSGQWFDDSGNKMWVNAAVAPNSATIIEVVRAIDSVVSVVSSSGVHLKNIKAEKGADHGFSFSGSTVNSSLAACQANKVGAWRGDDSGFLLEGLSAGALSTGVNLTDCAASQCQGDGIKTFKQLSITVRNFAATNCGRGVTLWGETKGGLFHAITTRTIAAAPGASGEKSALLIRDDSATDTGNNSANTFLSCDFESNHTNTVKVLDGNGDNTLRSTRVSIGADPGSGGAAGLGLVYNGQNDGGTLFVDDCTIVNEFSSGSPDQVLVNTIANTETVFTKNTYYQPNGTNSTYIYLGVTYSNADRAAAFSAFAAASGETGSYGEP